jgi:hypothetical protein
MLSYRCFWPDLPRCPLSLRCEENSGRWARHFVHPDPTQGPTRLRQICRKCVGRRTRDVPATHTVPTRPERAAYVRSLGRSGMGRLASVAEREIGHTSSAGGVLMPTERFKNDGRLAAPPRSCPSAPGCRDRLHPHWLCGRSPRKSLVQCIRAGWCHGCGTACPGHRSRGTGRVSPMDCSRRLRRGSEAVQAGASYPQSASNPAIPPYAQPSLRRKNSVQLRPRPRRNGSPYPPAARSRRKVHEYRLG